MSPLFPALISFLTISSVLAASDSYFDISQVFCTEAFCKMQTDQKPCRNLPEKCEIQNATHSGLILLEPTACNCCDYCLENLNEGDGCSSGGVGSGVPTTICGPGLVCNPKTNKCDKMTGATGGPCSKEMDAYLKARADGTLGATQEAPNCELNGFYKPYKCKNGETCHCVDPNGKRIYGEVPFSTTAKYDLTCACSRKYAAASLLFTTPLRPDQVFRCVENGDYDTLQCIDKYCYCVNPKNGLPLDTKATPVKIDNIANATCYNEAIHGVDSYLKRCAAEYLELAESVNDVKDDYNGIYQYTYPNCDLNGNYGPVQVDYLKDLAYCVTPDGKRIGSYHGDVKTVKNMNCNCAKSKLLIPTNNQEQSECAENGNFAKIQCRRGVCFCVDENGFQIALEVPLENKADLDCQ